MAKARVCPLKPTTIPRLELQAATRSVKIANILDNELDYISATHHFWTDSQVVLGYIHNETKRFHMYVANRVERIRQTSRPEQWNYVASAENPADHASRRLTTEEMLASNWLTGPKFLWENEIPPQDVTAEIFPDDVEVKSATVHATQAETFTSFEERLTRFSSLENALKAVAVIVKCSYRKRGLSIDEVEAKQVAERNLICAIQKEAFREERKQLDKSDSLATSKSNSLRQLDPFLDDHDLLRVGGSNFMGAKHELKKGLSELDENQIATQLLKINCEFRMNPPASSHMGGVWELQIRNVRNVLNGILDPSGTLLSTSSLRTFLYETMAIINSRPLTVEDLECPDGPLPLTPNHVLTMKSGLVLPPQGQFVKEDLYLRKRWRRVQYLVNLFWAHWKKEYLHTLQARKTSSQPQPNIEANDIVILQDESLCRTDWRIAKVIETISSDDGLVRRATLLMATPDLDEQGQPLHKRSVIERHVHN
ncbi:uncharacterized protein [Diadema antillarum]|uniref:uncharacterized protein n=1 Tax=Diadema antillarum TaxID=105358 RepID=UPI003A83D375